MSFLDATLGASGKLERLKIKHEHLQRGQLDRTIEALFNPNQLRYDHRVDWRAAGTVAQSIAGGYQRLEFQGTPPSTLALDLFFDTYEGDRGSDESSLLGSLRSSLVPDNPLDGGTPSATNVSIHTRKVAALAQVRSELHRPPVCSLVWGETELFRGVLTQLHEDFTFFLPNGMPVRATLNCTFMAYRTFGQAVSEVELHSPDVHKRRVVRRGDTLGRIAVEEYNDASRWRLIAHENGIDNPRALVPGQVLVIPKLER
ncbi:MAG: LysM peptidoglycan-binding domain-containing protein [Deltaproteobacteria bacterium]|nr:LysM peptidoglycan-binding domain-containing protein [Deltaproteobacteria bacterium]MCW5809013.1 LysM peptidoglycan-binding domain-containing protein [Deltaproteobacteria bacterium]